MIWVALLSYSTPVLASADSCSKSFIGSFIKKTESQINNFFDSIVHRKRAKLKRRISQAGLHPERASIAEILDAGIVLKLEDLHLLGVPKEAASYFNLRTGEFTYEPVFKELRPENGDAELERIWMTLPNAKYSESSEFEGLARKLLESLPDLSLTVLGGLSHQVVKTRLSSFAKNSLGENRLFFKLGNGFETLSPWAQDIGKPTKQNIILTPSKYNFGYEIPQKATKRLLNKKDDAPSFVTSDSVFRFDGGDIVVGDRNIFVGAGIVETNAVLLRLPRKKIKELLAAEFGKEIVIVGATKRGAEKEYVDYHTDLTMAVVRNLNTGKEVVLLSSSEAAASFLDGTSPKNVEILKSLEHRSVKKREHRLRQFELELKRKGYETIKIPGNFEENSFYELREKTYHESESGRRRIPRVFNYTNLVLGKGKAILPIYDLPIFDNYMKELLEGFGYEVIEAYQGRRLIQFAGSVRCALCPY